MINIYPSNHLENLAVLLEKVMQTGTSSNVLDEEVILVQSKGMQHWLNLKLAQSRGISMNLAFSLPMQFFWSQIRAILGNNKVPEQSLYTREVLSWRIFSLLASDEITGSPLCKEANNYWQSKDQHAGADSDKRFQLASQLADLYEQYQIFRPDWIQKWSSENSQAENWQALIWKLLVKQHPEHPVSLFNQAIKILKQKKCNFPPRISLFGINTLPPLWLDFLSQLGEQTQVHFFHLNPCAEYWGDLKTDKAQAREYYYRWLNNQPDSEFLSSDGSLVNPLLANLGAQGKDLLYLLQDSCSIEIPVFESAVQSVSAPDKPVTILQKVQDDILNLYDARQKAQKIADDSIVIASAHSALREVQALHDWLLHQINNDDSLTPKDILVMCPNVENYAPYIEAVFAHNWGELNESVPPLPCSIADRTLKESEPLVQAFIDLLQLPDSRFQFSQIMAYLRLPAIQSKFCLSKDDLISFENWINQAGIHWGLDAGHKQKILFEQTISDSSGNSNYTWTQGLNRLLLGFAYGDQQQIYQNQLLLPDVEGEQGVLLGRFIELLEQLQFLAQELTRMRTPQQWKQFLLQAKDSLFSSISEDENAQQIIEQAIDDLAEYTNQANYNQSIPLSIIRDFMLAHFNQPEPGRQFMSGQVTFCSMLPMRSIPFRVIAILGLNDSDFPRQRQAMGFDLMAQEPPRRGDRSRRGDDRYLFLEALISCREKLYLSYQGYDIKTNDRREPSLVLNELEDYLQKAYSLRQIKIPLQSFSKANYLKPLQSFNQHWLELSEPADYRDNLVQIEDDITETQSQDYNDEIILTAEDLLRFFDNPSKVFAQNKLGLYLEENQSPLIDDSEPFSYTNLDQYDIQHKLINEVIKAEQTLQEDQAIEQLMQEFDLSGKYPDTPNAKDNLQLWKQQSIEFGQYIKSQYLNKNGDNQLNCKTVKLDIDGVQLQAELPLIDNNLLFWRMTTPKPKDDMRLWIHHLVAQAYFNCEEQITRGVFTGGKNQSIQTISFEKVGTPLKQLEQLIKSWKKGMQQPLLLNTVLGQAHCLINKTSKPLDNFSFKQLWQGNNSTRGLSSDPYIQWFWSERQETLPNWERDWKDSIEQIYSPLYNHRQQ